MAMPVNERKQITSQNIFTNLVQLDGKFQILISGLTDSTVTFQATLDGVTFHDIETFTSNGIHQSALRYSLSPVVACRYALILLGSLP